MKHNFTFKRLSMNKNEINKRAENITTELYKIADMARIIYEVTSYNAEEGNDWGDIIEILEILNKKLNSIIELSETQECSLYNRI